MSKKKRLGRGLEALLGVVKPAKEETKVDSDTKSDRPTSGIELQVPGVEVDSIEDIKQSEAEKTVVDSSLKPASATQSDEPTILKFTPAASSNSSSPKPDSVEATTPPTTQAEKQYEVLDSAPEDVRALSSKTPSTASVQSASSTDSKSNIVELNVYDVDDNPFQPRREFNKTEIESLAESLKTHEQLQPILVRRVGGRYQLISGERRLRAAIHAGWSKIHAQVREADDRLVAELAIVENLQRKDLNPVEKALSFRRYLDQHGCTHEDLAGRLKIDRSTVANLLRLLELPEVVQKALQVGIISNGHARALLPLGEEHLQIEFCNRIQREGLSVRAIEQLVRDKIDEEDGVKKKAATKGRTKSNQILSLESELRSALGTKIEIKPSSGGRGKIVVHYLSRDEFERLRQLFGDSGGESKREAA